jgi:putative Ca2+/H+ antiporter (TMEM165/GDT1 family)
MARKLIVEIVADSTKFLQSMKASSAATTKFAAGVDKVAVSSEVAAKAQVAAAVKTTESLKLQVAEYKRLAAAAEVGSKEQIAAANLAAQAERKLAVSLGVAAHEAQNLQKHSGLLGRDVSKATRGALAGSGIFHTFGRSLAFASGGFIAFESVTKFLTDSINAAREAGVAQRSLAAQMKASGESFQVNRAEIEKVSLSYGKFGFQNDEVVASLTVLERGTGKISEAIRLQGLTADIARAKNISLGAAANVVAKVFGRQETALRRAVPGLDKNAHGWDLIAEAQRKMAGQAAANTTVSERFAATLHNTEEIIGSALLPTLNKYLTSLSKWMDDTRNQEKLQRAANTVAKDGGAAFSILADGIGKASAAYTTLNDVIKKIPGNKGGLKGAFLAGLQDWLPQIALVQQAAKAIQAFQNRNQSGAPISRNARDAMGRSPGGAGAFLPIIPAAAARPTSLQGRFNIQELKLAQAQITARLSDDRRILVVEQRITEQQIKQAKTLKDRTALTVQLAGLVGQIRNIDQQAADAVKAQAQARKDAADAARQAAKDAADAAKALKAARVQTAFDWADLGLEKAQATKGIQDDIKALQKIIAMIKTQIRLTGLTVDLARKLFETRQQLKDVRGQQGQQKLKKGAFTDLMQFDPDEVLGGWANDPRRAAAMRAQGFGLFRTPAGAVTRSAGPGVGRVITINGGLHLHGVQNVAQLETELMKRSKQRPTPRRGT